MKAFNALTLYLSLFVSITLKTSAQTELLSNGGFESGSASWTLNGATATTLYSFARSGSYYLWHGGAVSFSDTAYQTVTIPSGISAATLSFYLNINSAEGATTAYDTLTLTIRNTSGTVLATLGTWSNRDQTSPGPCCYSLKSFNMIAHAGTTVRIHFASSNDGDAVTNFRVDDASLVVTSGETVSAPGGVTGEPNPTVGVSYNYTVGSATSSLGHSVEYSFNWGDGTSSSYSTSRTRSHSWSTTGIKTIVVTARCATHNGISNNNSPGNYVDVQPADPAPDLVSVTVPSTITVGQAFTVTITAENDAGTGGLYSAINASVLFSDGGSELTIGSATAPWADDIYVFEPSHAINNSSCVSILASHWFVEATDDNWTSGEQHQFSFTVTPLRAGTIYVRTRVTLHDGDSGCVYVNDAAAPGGTAATDQQGWSVRQYSVTATPPAYQLNVNVSGSGTVTLSPPGGNYAAGTRITVTASPGANYVFSELTGDLYSRESVFAFDKGGADESITIRFIPTFTPPTIDFRVAGTTPSVIVGIPTAPTWLTFCERSDDLVTWIICRVFRYNGTQQTFSTPTTGQGFLRTTTHPEVTTPAFLNFPIHDGLGPNSAPVTALMDHHRTTPAVRIATDKDRSIRTLLGDTYPVLLGDQGPGKDFARLPAGINAPATLNYVGVTGQGGDRYLQYDGHAGYDYRYDAGVDVYAAGAGTVLTDADLAGSNLAGTGIASKYMSDYHALIIRHSSGYCTVYMHLSWIDPRYVDTSDPLNWRPTSAPIVIGDPIGEVGNFAKNQTLNNHLHFEVWRLDGTTWAFADPYGSQVTVDSQIDAITPRIWNP